jgi:hypothetical protein
MGFLSGIGKALKGIGGKVLGAVSKFAGSKIGSILQGGLKLFTGGVGGLIGKGLDMLKNSGIGSKLMDTFKGVASKFLGNASSMLSGSGLGTVGNFLQQMTGQGQQNGSSNILDTFKNLIGNWLQPQQNGQPSVAQSDPQTFAAAQQNAQQMAAYYQSINIAQMAANAGYRLS